MPDPPGKSRTRARKWGANSFESPTPPPSIPTSSAPTSPVGPVRNIKEAKVFLELHALTDTEDVLTTELLANALLEITQEKPIPAHIALSIKAVGMLLVSNLTLAQTQINPSLQQKRF